MSKLDPTQKIVKNFTAIETKVADGALRTLVVKISTPTPDRSKDIVEPKGMNSDNFMKNPVVLFAHNYGELPIAKCTGLKVADTGILATVQFPEEGTYPKADTVYQMYKDGFLNAWSVGFQPIDNGYEPNEEGGYTFKSWELLEFSSVPVPANAEALTIMRSKGINIDALNQTKKIEEKGKIEEEKKDADNPADSGYTDDTKISDLTVKQLKNIIDECLDAEQMEEGEEDGEKAFDQAIEKVGRSISARHEAMLRECKDMHDKCIKHIETILSTVEDEGDKEDTGKTIEQSGSVLAGLVKSLKQDLKKTDKDVGLALRTLKMFESGKGGEKK